MNFVRKIFAGFRRFIGFVAVGSAASSSAVAQPQERSSASDAIVYRLTWLELQINPMVYRFAYAAGKPMLVSLPGENGGNGAVLLVRPDHVPEVYDRTVEPLDGLVRKCGVMHVPMVNPNEAFTDEAMKTPSVHLRFAYSDKTACAMRGKRRSRLPTCTVCRLFI